jgi:hypothetical protein
MELQWESLIAPYPMLKFVACIPCLTLFPYLNHQIGWYYSHPQLITYLRSIAMATKFTKQVARYQ